MKTNFPDKQYLKDLIASLKDNYEANQDEVQQLLTQSGIALNSIADYITDTNAKWDKKKLKIDELYLTGTNPELNKIIVDRCQHSVIQLRELFKKDKAVMKLFAEFKFSKVPILVVHQNNNYKVLDGMHRVIAAIRDDMLEIEAFVVSLNSQPKPQCEAHVVYDLLRTYHRGINQDKEALIVALKYLKDSYANVEDLLRNRFNKDWLPNDEMQEIIKEVLKD